MHRLITQILLIVIPAISIAQSGSYVVGFHMNRIFLTVPKELKTMPDSLLHKKYNGVKQRPDLALSNADGKVNILAALIDQDATEARLPDIKVEWIIEMKKANPDMVGLSDGMKKINGKLVGYWKCLSSKRNLHAFNQFFFAVVDKKIYLINFNCEQSLQKDWENRADVIMASLVIK